MNPVLGAGPESPSRTDRKVVVSSPRGQKGTGSLQMLISGQFHRPDQ